MKQMLTRWLGSILDFRGVIGLKSLPRFAADYVRLRRAARGERMQLRDLHIRFGDDTRYTRFDPHYFYQGMWLASRVADPVPAVHVDIGSDIRLLGALAGFLPVVFADYRPVNIKAERMLPVACDITRLAFADCSVSSLSCLHVIEHIGLGRYGDPIDIGGSKRAAGELTRVLAPDGRLYVSAPVGRARVEFNAHRVFALPMLIEMFAGLEVISCSGVDDNGCFHERFDVVTAAGCEYGCALLELRKPSAPEV